MSSVWIGSISILGVIIVTILIILLIIKCRNKPGPIPRPTTRKPLTSFSTNYPTTINPLTSLSTNYPTTISTSPPTTISTSPPTTISTSPPTTISTSPPTTMPPPFPIRNFNTLLGFAFSDPPQTGNSYPVSLRNIIDADHYNLISHSGTDAGWTINMTTYSDGQLFTKDGFDNNLYFTPPVLGEQYVLTIVDMGWKTYLDKIGVGNIMQIRITNGVDTYYISNNAGFGQPIVASSTSSNLAFYKTFEHISWYTYTELTSPIITTAPPPIKNLSAFIAFNGGFTPTTDPVNIMRLTAVDVDNTKFAYLNGLTGTLPAGYVVNMTIEKPSLKVIFTIAGNPWYFQPMTVNQVIGLKPTYAGWDAFIANPAGDDNIVSIIVTDGTDTYTLSLKDPATQDQDIVARSGQQLMIFFKDAAHLSYYTYAEIAA